MRAIQITLDERLLADLDADDEVKRDGRSAVLRRAVEQARLSKYVGQLGPEKMRDVCRALAIAAGCA